MSKFAGYYTFIYHKVGYEGQLANEVIYSGNAILTDNRIVSFARLGEGPFGYAGHYIAEGDRFRISIESCLAPDLEGQVFDWHFRWENDRDCLLYGRELSTGRDFESLVRRH
jgi:hypothetical protein